MVPVKNVCTKSPQNGTIIISGGPDNGIGEGCNLEVYGTYLPYEYPSRLSREFRKASKSF